MENGMQEFAPDATTTPAGSVHQHRCGMKKSSLNINFFFENQIFSLVLKAFCNLLWWHQNIDKDVQPWNRTVGQTSPKNYDYICIPKTYKIFLKFRAIAIFNFWPKPNFWRHIRLLSQCEEAQHIFEKGQVFKFCIESVFKLLDMEMHVFEINIAFAIS